MAEKISKYKKIKFREKLLIKYDIYRERKNNEPLIRKSLAKINNYTELKNKLNDCQFRLIEKILKKYNLEYYFLNYNLNIALKLYIRDIPDLLCPVCKVNYKKIQDKSFILNLCDNCLQTQEGKNFLKELKTKKTKETSIKKYGTDNVMKLKKIKNKLIENSIKKYNVKNPSQKHLKNYKKLNKEFIKNNFIENGKFKLKEFMQFFNCDQVTAHAYLKRFNIKWKKHSYSNSEKEILNFTKEIYSGEIIENSRKIISPYELDIFIPEKNLAIEFDGLLWHSEGLKNFKENIKHYHLEKTKLAEEKNINLLHIFENEWLDPIKQDIWKSIISYKLRIVKQRYFARKLQIKEVNNKEAREFFEKNHIQGYANAGIKIGLYDNQKLISCMTFAKPRFNKNYQYELIRFASIKYSSCVGCAQKLFKYFLRTYQPKSIISYANRRWAFAKSNVYQKLGFKFLRETEPNYYYFKLNEMKFYHRSQFQKYKLKNYPDIKDHYNPSLTESEIMFNSGYRKIYDAGHLTFEWKI